MMLWKYALAMVPLLSVQAASASADVPFVATEAEQGTLSVSSDPPARIAVDDKDTGLVTPQGAIPLSVGRHRLTLTTPDGKHKSLGFVIRPGETTRLRVTL